MLLVIGTATALLTDKESSQVIVKHSRRDSGYNSFRRCNYRRIDRAVSGQTFDIEPIVTNAGTVNVYAFLEIDVPMLGYVPCDSSDRLGIGSSSG